MAVTVLLMGVMHSALPGRLEYQPAGGEAPTLRELIEALSGDSASLAGILLDEHGGLKPDYVVLINGQNARLLQGAETPVPDGSTVIITAPISGG